MSRQSNLEVGVFVDVAYLARNGGYGMRYDVLREFACRDGAEPLRLNAYVSFDVERADEDPAYRDGQDRFYSLLRDFGYKVIPRSIQWETDEGGNRYGRANAALHLAVDALLQSEKLDRVLIATGDGDFTQVVRALQTKGCRVEVLAFDNVSVELRREADLYMSGYLVPHLLPVQAARDLPPWGEIGSRVRGICYAHAGKGYGFLRYLKSLSPDLWKTDSRQADSPYGSVFCHDSQLPLDVTPADLPSRHHVFEFELARAEGRENSLQAVNVQLVSPRRRDDRERADRNERSERGDRGDRGERGERGQERFNRGRVPYELKSPEEQLASYEPKITFDS